MSQRSKQTPMTEDFLRAAWSVCSLPDRCTASRLGLWACSLSRWWLRVARLRGQVWVHNLLTEYLPPSWLPWAHFLTCRAAVTTTHTYLSNFHPFSKDHWRIKSVNTCRSSQNRIWLTRHSQCEPPSPFSSPSPPYTGQGTVPTAANTTKTTGLTVREEVPLRYQQAHLRALRSGSALTSQPPSGTPDYSHPVPVHMGQPSLLPCTCVCF